MNSSSYQDFVDYPTLYNPLATLQSEITCEGHILGLSPKQMIFAPLLPPRRGGLLEVSRI